VLQQAVAAREVGVGGWRWYHWIRLHLRIILVVKSLKMELDWASCGNFGENLDFFFFAVFFLGAVEEGVLQQAVAAREVGVGRRYWYHWIRELSRIVLVVKKLKMELYWARYDDFCEIWKYFRIFFSAVFNFWVLGCLNRQCRRGKWESTW
jgi:hypothetical protein